MFNERARPAVKAADAWTGRDPKNAEAWFYLAAAYAPLVQWQVLRGERVGAARNGNRIREALLKALEIDPSMADAHFGIGVYEYYADVAPAAAKVLRFFLFLPAGDRARGLTAIDKTRESGAVLRGEADFQRYIIDIWYEHKPEEALDPQVINARYQPTRSSFSIAKLYDTYLRHTSESAAAWRQLIDRARRDRVYKSTRVIAFAERKRRARLSRAVCA
jgi:hypothetical protein